MDSGFVASIDSFLGSSTLEWFKKKGIEAKKNNAVGHSYIFSTPAMDLRLG